MMIFCYEHCEYGCVVPVIRNLASLSGSMRRGVTGLTIRDGVVYPAGFRGKDRHSGAGLPSGPAGHRRDGLMRLVQTVFHWW